MDRAGVVVCPGDSSVQEDKALHWDLRSQWGRRIQQNRGLQECEGQSDYNKSLNHRAEEEMNLLGNKTLQKRFTEL